MVEYLCQRLEKARRDSMRAGVGLLPFNDCSRTWICAMRSKWQSFLPGKSGNFFASISALVMGFLSLKNCMSTVPSRASSLAHIRRPSCSS